MATEGFLGYYVETRDYKATAAYVFIAEQHDREPTTHPILQVADSAKFAPTTGLQMTRQFEPQHWGVVGSLRSGRGCLWGRTRGRG